MYNKVFHNCYFNYNDIDITILEQSLKNNKIQKLELENTLNNLITQKPLKVDKPILSIDECHKEILKYFKSIKVFNKYILNSNNNNITSTTSSISYDKYKELIIFKQTQENILTNNKKTILYCCLYY